MDVSLSGCRVDRFFLFLIFLAASSCGDRYDLATERGRQARIDDANFHLSKGECAAADEAINPLYGSTYVNDEVRIVKASAQACFARFNLLNLISGFSGSTNYFQSLAKSLDNVAGDSARTWLYAAADVLTQNGSAMGAYQRSHSENAYMVFLQFGVIAAIIRNYGSPDSAGVQGTNLTYPAGNMSNVDACALAGALSFISDSFGSADLTDTDSVNAVNAINSVCVSAGLTSCAALNRDRSQCDGVNQNSVRAGGVATSVNSAW